MNKLLYATSKDPISARCRLFAANTQGAGTAPTFTSISERKVFSADFIRHVDNNLYSLPENFKSGEYLWDDGNLFFDNLSADEEVDLVATHFYSILSNHKIPILSWWRSCNQICSIKSAG